jgi:hypothetical protein
MPKSRHQVHEDADSEDDLSFRSNLLIFEEEEDDISLNSETSTDDKEEVSNPRYATIRKSIFGDDKNTSTLKRNKERMKKVSFYSEPTTPSSQKKPNNTKKTFPKKNTEKTDATPTKTQVKSVHKVKQSANQKTDTRMKGSKQKANDVEAATDPHDNVIDVDEEGEEKEEEEEESKEDTIPTKTTTTPTHEEDNEPNESIKETTTDTTSTLKESSESSKDSSSNSKLIVKDQHITFGRKVSHVLSSIPYLGKIYNPTQTKSVIIIKSANIEEGTPEKSVSPPNLEKGWEFYEHWTLPRCFVKKTFASSEQEDSSFTSSRFRRWIGNQRKYIRADAGEKKDETMLYPLWGTSMADMADFGVGVGLYFKMLRYFMIVSFIAGLMSIPIMAYYSKEYARSDSDESSGQISKIMNMINVGSAICTNARWEVCPSCNNGDIPAFRNARRIITANRTFLNENGYSQTEKIGFIYKNYCEFDAVMGIWNLVVLLFLVLATIAYMFVHRRQLIAMNDAQKTTCDYSILITVSASVFITFN